MYIGHGRLNPTDVSAAFSGMAGALTAKFAYDHRLSQLIALNACWLASLVFIRLRARAREGKLLNLPAELYLGLAIASYAIGLLMAGIYYLVYRAT